MDVVDVAQAKIAEEAGACAVMALERVPADIRKDGECHVPANLVLHAEQEKQLVGAILRSPRDNPHLSPPPARYAQAASPACLTRR